MYLTRTNVIRWGWLILFGLTSFAGDALHWVPGVKCGTHRHASADAACNHGHSHSHYGHAHHGHAHHHHAEVSQVSTNAEANSRIDCNTDCLICRWLAMQSVVPEVFTSEISSPHVALVLPQLSSRLERDLPRSAAPRGPPAFAA